MTVTEIRKVTLTKDEVALLSEVLDWAASKVAKTEKLDDLKAKIKLEWMEADAEFLHDTPYPWIDARRSNPL